MQRKMVVAGWAAAAAVAVAAGIGAVALAQGGTLSPPTEPMSEDEVLAELESVQADEPTSDGTPSSEPPSEEPAPSGELDQVPPESGQEAGLVLDKTGGAVLAQCVDGAVELVWWVADQGWRISTVDPGPDEDAEIEFESDDRTAEWNFWCAGGRAEVAVEFDDRDDDDD